MQAYSSLKEVSLPDFRNLGVLLRIFIVVEIINFVVVALEAEDLPGFLTLFANLSGVWAPALLLALLFLLAASAWLGKLPYRIGATVVMAGCVVTTTGWLFVYQHDLVFQSPLDLRRAVLSTVLISGFVLFYFNWRQRRFSPGLVEARLMALQSRIRPHFLFNSINTVLGLIRTDPRRAEAVLESLADLFRASLSETNVLVPLRKELELARSYLDVEAIRLGGRLSVNWQCQNAPLDAMVPPMLLQPLLENAVYHGIEPAESGGEVSVTAFAKADQLNLVVRNPICPGQQRRSGNRMALNNIRERLDLHFDAEATMRAYEAGDEFVVQIRVPYKNGQAT